MYLLVFITLVISLIGIYAQVLSLQAARLASGQTTVAQEMMRWHSTAIAQAKYAQIAPAPGLAGCDLTVAGIVGVTCNGFYGSAVVSASVSFAWVPHVCGASVPPCFSPLPLGYQDTIYIFNSIYFKTVSGQAYVITFVPPPTITAANPAPGFVTLPRNIAGAKQIGITLSELLTQIRNGGVNPMYYGIVNAANQLVTPPISNGATAASFQYTVPVTVPAGSIGIVSAP